jgi:hypothetical protein
MATKPENFDEVYEACQRLFDKDGASARRSVSDRCIRASDRITSSAAEIHSRARAGAIRHAHVRADEAAHAAARARVTATGETLH